LCSLRRSSLCCQDVLCCFEAPAKQNMSHRAQEWIANGLNHCRYYVVQD
jgi:hypothetical protein